MSNFELRFENPWLLLALFPAAFIILVSWIRVPGSRRADLTCTLPLALRLATVVLIVLILSGFSVVTNHAGSAMMILLDRSDSAQNAQKTMLEDAGQIALDAPSDLRLALASFAGDSATEYDFGRIPAQMEPSAEVRGEATSLASALVSASKAFPDNTLKRIVVLTDGKITDGDTAAAASELANKGIRLDALLYDTAIQTPEAEVTAFSLPADAALGQTIQASVTIVSNAETRGTLRLYDEELLMLEQTVDLIPGENEFSFPLTPSNAGMRAFAAELEPETDTLEQNNRIDQVLRVTSTDAILIVDGTGTESGLLSDLLIQNGYDVTVTASADVPTRIAELCEYGMMILMNVDAQDLPNALPAQLEQYVSLYGRSVLTTGGRNTYIYGNMKETAFESFLPIDMEVEERESAEPIALMLLLDNSASMEGTAITMAKRGAIKSIESLNPNDYIGVITFSTEHSVLAPLSPMSEKDEIISAVSSLGTVMGTMYSGALQEAQRQLTAFDSATQKHIILLSDGNPSDSDFEIYIQQMREANITTSTIVLGNDISEDLMRELAELGGGESYIVTSSFDLPSIMMTDTILLQVEYECVGKFTPKQARGAFSGIKAPLLGGYVRAQAKPAASVLLTSQADHPLFARWNYGSGMAASLMSDLSGQWSSEWFASEDGQTLILNMVDSMLQGAHANAAVSVRLIPGGSSVTLEVSTADAQDGQRFTATVTTPNGNVQSLVLSAVDSGVYQREMPLDGFGKYAVTLQQYDDAGEIATLETAATVSWSPEYEVFDWDDPSQTLRQLCAMTGGTLVNSPQELLAQRIDDMYIRYDPSFALAVAASLLMLLDIVIRRMKPRFLSGISLALRARRARRIRA